MLKHDVTTRFAYLNLMILTFSDLENVLFIESQCDLRKVHFIEALCHFFKKNVFFCTALRRSAICVPKMTPYLTKTTPERIWQKRSCSSLAFFGPQKRCRHQKRTKHIHLQDHSVWPGPHFVNNLDHQVDWLEKGLVQNLFLIKTHQDSQFCFNLRNERKKRFLATWASIVA